MLCEKHRCEFTLDRRGVLFCHLCARDYWAAEERSRKRPEPYLPWWAWVLAVVGACAALGTIYYVSGWIERAGP